MTSHGHTRLSQVYANTDSVVYLPIIEFFSTTFLTPNDGIKLSKCNPTKLVIRKTKTKNNQTFVDVNMKNFDILQLTYMELCLHRHC